MSNNLMSTHILDLRNMLECIQVHNKFELSIRNKSHVLTASTMLMTMASREKKFELYFLDKETAKKFEDKYKECQVVIAKLSYGEGNTISWHNDFSNTSGGSMLVGDVEPLSS
jgi:hypothetical protein